jgi:phage-related protein (TIGR01555 family)
MARAKTVKDALVTLGAAEPKVPRADSWQNLISGFGVAGKDPRLAAEAQVCEVDWQTAETLWRGNDLGARIVETHPDDMTREGWEITAEDSENSAIEATASKMDAMDVQAKFYEALTYARAYGGGGILLGADDGSRDLTMPLQPQAVRSFEWMNVLMPQELKPQRWYENANAPKYGDPEIYMLTPLMGGGSQLVHESRVIRFDGTVVSKNHRRQVPNGWGDSIFARVLPVLRDFDGAWDGAGVIAANFAQSVMKMKGLADLLASETPEDAQAFRRRVQAVLYSMSLLNTTLIDSEGEDYERKTTNLTGFPDLLDKFATRLAAAARLPVMKLLGISASGLNPSGAADLRFYYDEIKSKQEKELRRPLNTIVELVSIATKQKLPENWVIRFRPLWQMTDQERAQYRKTVLEGTEIAVRNQMITPEEAATSHFAGDQFSEDIHLSTEDRDALAADRMEREAEAAKLNAEATRPPVDKGPPAK